MNISVDQLLEERVKLINACKEYRRQLDEAQKDKARLDWLESHRAEIDTDGPGFVIYTESQGLGGGASRGSYKTLRAAIDAAMTLLPNE